MFHTCFKHDLHANADTQHWARTCQALANNARPTYRVQSLHTGRERTNAWYDKARGLDCLFGVAGDVNACADVFKGTLGGTQVSGAII
ncbi:hypothetical protein GCM10009537_03010 [Corynebacterium riegelii]